MSKSQSLFFGTCCKVGRSSLLFQVNGYCCTIRKCYTKLWLMEHHTIGLCNYYDTGRNWTSLHRSLYLSKTTRSLAIVRERNITRPIKYYNRCTFTTTPAPNRASSTELLQQSLTPSSSQQQQKQQRDQPSFHDEFQFILLLLRRMMMGLGIVHCFTQYVMDITLCSGPSMLPTIQESNEIILIDRFAIYKGDVQDGTTVASRTRAAQQHQLQQSSSSSSTQIDSSANLWNAIRLGGGGGGGGTNDEVSTKSQSTLLTWREVIEHITSPISVGDVVVAQNPNRPGTICKRILGLPGDQVIAFNTGNGTYRDNTIQIVPDNHVWLEGDNANNSLDSRQSGPISLALLRGRAVARIWPLRGNAYLKRTISPTPPTVYSAAGSSQCCSNSIVIPAGYSQQLIFGPTQQGQHDKS